MHQHRTMMGWTLFGLLSSSLILTTIAYPQSKPELQMHQQQQYPVYSSRNGFIPISEAQNEERKFAEKPNALKKVALDDIDEDIQTNQIQETGFSWTNMLSTFMQMMFSNNNVGPTKSDDIDTNAVSGGGFGNSPWANYLSVGLKIITTLLGGGQQNDGIDKVDNGGGSPVQTIVAAVLSGLLGNRDPEQVNTMAKQAGEFFNIVLTLLDALKTSFSHRSLAARSIGKKDSVSDATVAGITMLKGYVKSTMAYDRPNEKCMQKHLCDANTECNADIGGTSVFCQLGTYATSFILERTSGTSFESLYDAGRKGRSGEDCRQIYLECNEVY